MFGTFRYVLAVMVIFSHLWRGLGIWPGDYAVYGFFMLSGYLMTFVLNKTYGFTIKGLLSYFENRALRIYPPYFAVLLISLGIISIMPETAYSWNKFLHFPQSVTEWLKNIFIFGLRIDPLKKNSLLVPTAWSLYIELTYYICLALFLARWRSLVVLWFLFSVGYTVYMVAADFPFYDRYFSIVSCSLPYSAGAMIYFFRPYLRKIPPWHMFTAAAAFFVNTALAKQIWDDPMLEGFYFSLAACAYLMVCLMNVNKHSIPGWFRKADKTLGDLSYPIFLLHPHVAAIVTIFIPANVKTGGGAFFFTSLIIVSVAGLILHKILEERVNVIRDRVRHSGTALSPKSAPAENGARS